jgi:hypothetical protein
MDPFQFARIYNSSSLFILRFLAKKVSRELVGRSRSKEIEPKS